MRTLKILWLAFLSVFPITSVIEKAHRELAEELAKKEEEDQAKKSSPRD